MSGDNIIEDLRSWWEIPSIAHFCSVFRAAFNLLDFGIEDLEESFLTVENEFCSLQTLIIALLQGCLDTDITVENWEQHLCQLLQEKLVKEEGRAHPFPSGNSDFNSLPLRTKAEIIHSLCQYRLDAVDVADSIKDIDSDDLRIEPIGKDSDGNTYWHFSGLRLYKESPWKNRQKKKNIKQEVVTKSGRQRKIPKLYCDSESEKELANKSPWSIVCVTENDWYKLASTLRKSKGLTDKQLHQTIADFLPRLQDIKMEQERNAKRRILELVPRRMSSRIGLKQKIKEEKDQIVATLAAEQEKKKQEEREKQRLNEEKDRKEREIRERAKRSQERLKAIEERANRAKIREQKLEYIDETDNSDNNSESILSGDEDSYRRKTRSSKQNSFSYNESVLSDNEDEASYGRKAQSCAQNSFLYNEGVLSDNEDEANCRRKTQSSNQNTFSYNKGVLSDNEDETSYRRKTRSCKQNIFSYNENVLSDNEDGASYRRKTRSCTQNSFSYITNGNSRRHRNSVKYYESSSDEDSANNNDYNEINKLQCVNLNHPDLRKTEVVECNSHCKDSHNILDGGIYVSRFYPHRFVDKQSGYQQCNGNSTEQKWTL